MKEYNDVSWDSDMTNNSLIVLNTVTVYIGNMCILFTSSMESMFYDNAQVVRLLFQDISKTEHGNSKNRYEFPKMRQHRFHLLSLFRRLATFIFMF
jgi:hypothetical protein